MTASIIAYETFFLEGIRRCAADEDTDSLHRWAMDALAGIGGAAEDDSPLVLWEETFDMYERILERRAQQAALPEDQRRIMDWAWPSWNAYIDPLEPGLLAVISAGDGMGKTIYAEGLAEHWAQRRNKVVFVHFELNRSIMFDRRTARHTGLTRRDLRSGELTRLQYESIQDARRRLLAWEGNISYLHTPGWDMERTIRELQRLKIDDRCDVVVIDYLEKCSASTRQQKLFGTNVFQREADNVEQIKNFAEATETPVLMLAQMSKAGKRTGIGDIDRSGMRGAGEKSEKANIVVLLTRERVEDGYSKLVDVRVDKNTVGRTGNFQQVMEPEYFRVADKYEPQTARQREAIK
jgi:replicative DNA helicase